MRNISRLLEWWSLHENYHIFVTTSQKEYRMHAGKYRGICVCWAIVTKHLSHVMMNLHSTRCVDSMSEKGFVRFSIYWHMELETPILTCAFLQKWRFEYSIEMNASDIVGNIEHTDGESFVWWTKNDSVRHCWHSQACNFIWLDSLTFLCYTNMWIYPWC